jgi:hypothetical protein
VLQDLFNHPRLGDERDDPHRGAAAGAHERIDLVDRANQIRPPAAQPPQLRIISRLGEHGGEVARGSLPVVLVLEEAQNYIQQPRFAEEESIARVVFERIAREGRKYGLSLVVASPPPRLLTRRDQELQILDWGPLRVQPGPSAMPSASHARDHFGQDCKPHSIPI